MQLQAAPS
ncbi:hypothetical protein EC900039_4758A, partial [Escherichia coli 90.0039]